jgi:hypothetical protein
MCPRWARIGANHMPASSSFFPAGVGTTRRCAGLLAPSHANRSSRLGAGLWIAVIVLVIGVVGVWTTAGLAQDDDSTRAARNAMAKSLDPIKGRFHRVHGMALKLHCGTCHASDQRDALIEGKVDPVAEMPGRVDRTVCAGCHKSSVRPGWSDR